MPMKHLIITAMLLLTGFMTCHAQDMLQKVSSMYDYMEET